MSLTGIVNYVHIKDSISNEYSFIMNNLKISNLKLFDTYGLDHANWNGDKGKILTDILYDFQEKKLLSFDSDLAIIYLYRDGARPARPDPRHRGGQGLHDKGGRGADAHGKDIPSRITFFTPIFQYLQTWAPSQNQYLSEIQRHPP